AGGGWAVVRCRASAARATGWPPTGDDHAVSRWWRRRSLRARLTIITTAGLAVALVVAAMLLRATLRASLTRDIDNTARQGAREVAALAQANRLPKLLLVPGTLTVQVLDPH